MVLLDWRLAAFALALLPLFVWLTKRVGEQRTDARDDLGEHRAALLDLGEQFMWRGAMVTNMPNYVRVIGYTNASWTLKVDLVAD